MNESSPNGPLIPESTNFQTNFTKILKITDKLESNILKVPNNNPTFVTPSPTFTTMSNGTISNLNNPINDQDGATLSYLQTIVGSPSDPIFSVQFNNSGVFGGNSSLLFNPTPSTLISQNITDGVLTIGSGTVNNLLDPILPQQAATKNYTDQFFGIKTLNQNGATQIYSASNMLNSIIYRTGWIGTTTDTTATATDIINAIGSVAQIGSSFNFSVRNNETVYSNIIHMNVGTDVTFSGDNPIIYPGYQYNGIVHVDSISPPAITLYTINCNIINNINFYSDLLGGGTYINVLNCYEKYNQFNNPTDSLSEYCIINKVVYANVDSIVTPPATIPVYLAKPEKFMGVLANSSIIVNPLIWKSGGSDFYLINQGTGNSILLDGDNSDNNSWTLDPNSNRIIPPGYTGWFLVYLDVDFPETVYSAKLFTLGIFPTT